MISRLFRIVSKSPSRGDFQEALSHHNFRSLTHLVPAVCYRTGPDEGAWYPPTMLGASVIGDRVLQVQQVQAALDLLSVLEPEPYTIYLMNFYREGLRRFGSKWRYADIVTVLITLAEMLRPRRYLEIGVRRGRSVCAVASRIPNCDLVMFDMWVDNYAGTNNPGPDFVRGQLKKVGFRGIAEFIDGDSHVTLPRYLEENTEVVFDLITVDGDHTEEGAAQDLSDVLPSLAVGGAIVFDDISHPQHLGLRDVWQRLVVDDPHFSTWSYTEVGYGVGFGIRKF